MKNIYRKTGMMMAVLALFVVLSMPCATAEPNEILTVEWDPPYIKVDATNCKPDHWYQILYYPPGEEPHTQYVSGGDYYTVFDPWSLDSESKTHSEEFDVRSSKHPIEGEWTGGLYKAGDGPIPGDGVKCMRVLVTLDAIPEFTTIAIPAIAILGLVAFYRRKQKK